jgi:anti-sigma factor RsiW
MNPRIRDILYRSYDETLSEQEQHELNQALKRSADLRREAQYIRDMRQELGSLPSVSFSEGFSDRVLKTVERLGRYRSSQPDFGTALVFMFRRLAVAAVMTVFTLLSVYWISDTTILPDGVQSVSQVSIEEVLIPTYQVQLEDIL